MIKNIVIVALVGICIYLMIMPRVVEKKKIPPAADTLVQAEVQRVTRKIDSQGFEHAVYEEIENVVPDYSKIKDSAKLELDSVVNLLNIKEKQLKEWRNVAYTWRDSFLLAQEIADTAYSYADKWANIEFIRPKDTMRGAYFNLKYDAEVNYAQYWEKKGLFGKKRDYIDVWVADKRATINGVKRIKIQPEERGRLEVNAIGQYYIKPSVGFEGYYEKGRFGVGGAYMYDFETKEFKPAFRVKANILQF